MAYVDKRTPSGRFERWRDMYNLGERRRFHREEITIAIVNAHGKYAEHWDRAAVLQTVDATCPVDADRQQRSLKAWRAERLSFIACVLGDEKIVQPTADDYGACIVAADLIEEGRTREAEQLLVQQAPRRHNRRCPACGAIAGRPCRDADAIVEAPRSAQRPPFTFTSMVEVRPSGERIVPHLSRVTPLTTTEQDGGAG